MLGRDLAVNKLNEHRFHMGRFNLKKLNNVESKEKYCIEVSNRFSPLEDLETEVEINSAWETVKEDINISAREGHGYYEMKKDKLWFDEMFKIVSSKETLLNCSGYGIQAQ
jgi:hypothetical protein